MHTVRNGKSCAMSLKRCFSPNIDHDCQVISGLWFWVQGSVYLPWPTNVSSHQVQCNIPTFEAFLWNLRTFFNDTGLATYGCALWCSQIVYICSDSLNTATAFYCATECSDGRKPHFTLWQSARTLQCLFEGVCMPQGWTLVSYSGCSVVPSVAG